MSYCVVTMFYCIIINDSNKFTSLQYHKDETYFQLKMIQKRFENIKFNSRLNMCYREKVSEVSAYDMNR